MNKSAHLILASLLAAGSFALSGCGDDGGGGQDAVDGDVAPDINDPDGADDSTDEDGTDDSTDEDATEEEVVELPENACITTANEEVLTTFAATEDCATLVDATNDAPSDCDTGSCVAELDSEECATAAACLAAATESAVGVDAPCSSCVGMFIACTIGNCIDACAGAPDSAACTDCAEDNCGESFESCAGFTVAADTCEIYGSAE